MRSRLWTVLAILAFPCVLLAIAGIQIFYGSVHAPVGEVLVYEIPGQATGGAPVDMDAVVRIVDRRLNPDRQRRAEVRLVQGNQIEIGVYGNDPDELKRAKRLLSKKGTLEFRILANRNDPKHGTWIKQAEQLPEDQVCVVDDQGHRKARFVRASVDEAPGTFDSAEIVTRSVGQEGERKLQILVLEDPWNVTGEFVRRARVATDDKGRPALELRFNDEGARRLGELTGSCLRDPNAGPQYRLGILFDGALVGAPAPRDEETNRPQKVTDRALFAGGFNRAEVEDFAAILNAGPLPAKLKEIEPADDKTR